MNDVSSFKRTATEFFRMSDSEFREMYESQSFQNILDFLETRIRLEILTIIRRFRLKGDVLFEVRKKSTASAYSKLQKELHERETEFGQREVHLFEILLDLIGVRLICLHDEVQKRLFEFILQVESLEIQKDGLEYYSAPFRDYTLEKDIHGDLADIIAKLNKQEAPDRVVEKKSKESNYESLHFYVKFASKVDHFLLLDLTKGRPWTSKGERIRDAAESDYLQSLYNNFNDLERKLVSIFPIEFQIRTITDHLWAQDEHKYVYKNNSTQHPDLEQKYTLEVVKGTFTGLKFAYYHVERLRALIESITHKKGLPAPSYTGSSKDLNSIRFKFFRDRSDEAETEFRGAERVFLDSKLDISDEAVVLKIIELYEYVTHIDVAQTEGAASPFDMESWGRKRIFYLFLAYIALFSKVKSLPAQTATRLATSVDLVDLVGEAAFDASVTDDEGCLKLASKLYERIETFDRFALSELGNSGETKELGEVIFSDPLVGIRLASSFFLQSEFAGAHRSMLDMFKLGGEQDLTSWHRLKLAEDFSKSEILMRYTQYIFFGSFGREERLLENFSDLIVAFDAVFENVSNEFCSERYRCYSWYYSLINYLYTQGALVPKPLLRHKGRCRAYLLEHLPAAKENIVFGKPETQLGQIHLAVHSENEDQRKISVNENHRIFEAAIAQHNSYPRIVNTHMVAMAENMRRRALDKIGRKKDITFLSYSRKNPVAARLIAGKLKEKGIDVVYDEDFRGGDDFSEKIEQAMSDATSAILFITPEYLSSRWCRSERGFLTDKRRREELRLLILRRDISQDELFEKAPLLSGLVNFSASDEDIDASLDKIITDILRRKP